MSENLHLKPWDEPWTPQTLALAAASAPANNCKWLDFQLCRDTRFPTNLLNDPVNYLLNPHAFIYVAEFVQFSQLSLLLRSFLQTPIRYQQEEKDSGHGCPNPGDAQCEVDRQGSHSSHSSHSQRPLCPTCWDPLAELQRLPEGCWSSDGVYCLTTGS